MEAVLEIMPTTPRKRTYSQDEVDQAVQDAIAKARSRTWFERYGFAVIFVVAQACSTLYISGKQSARLDEIESTQKTMSSSMITADAVKTRFDGTENEIRNLAQATDKLTARIERLENAAMSHR